MRGFEVDLHVEAEAAVDRAKFREGCPGLDADVAEDLEPAPRRVAGGDAGLVDRLDEGERGPVEDRHLGAVDLDQSVVDAQPVQGGHQVLDGGDRAGLDVTQDGAEFGGGDEGVMRLDQAVVAVGGAGAEEGDAVIGRSGSDGDLGGVAGVNSDPRESRRPFEGRLFMRSHSLAPGRDQFPPPRLGVRRN